MEPFPIPGMIETCSSLQRSVQDKRTGGKFFLQGQSYETNSQWAAKRDSKRDQEQGLHVGVYQSKYERKVTAASDQFYWADERMSKQACLFQTPTLPGQLSKGHSRKALLRLRLFSITALPCLSQYFLKHSVLRCYISVLWFANIFSHSCAANSPLPKMILQFPGLAAVGVWHLCK